MEREYNGILENSGVCVYIRNQAAEYLFVSHLISQYILTTPFANIGIILLSSGFCTTFLGLP